MTSLCSRRQMMGYMFAGSALVLAGCGSDQAVASDTPAADGKAAKPAMLVYRDPQCGCCGKWAEQAEAAGYPVTMEMRDDMAAVKTSLGVPSDLASCHTVMVGGYVLEGHVPFDHVAKLLSDQPKDIIGIAVPGMPRGSPGMEMPDGSVDEFDVVGFARSGATRLHML
jgi:hypothetical protein